VGLTSIVDAVMVGETVAELVAGDPEPAHHLGVQASRAFYGVPVEEPADVVAAEAFPTDIDLRQAIKAVCAADIVVRDGGVIVLGAECPEGVSPQFPDFEERGFLDPDALYEDVEAGRFSNKLLAYTLVAIGRIVCKRASGVLVSPHIDRAAAERMGFAWAADLDQGLALARERVGGPCRISVLRSAGELLPLPRW
jgi:nickel-dependent lactate racemase